MKDIVRATLVPLSIVIASLVIGIGIICAARIIGDSIEAKETYSSVRMVSELVKTLKEKDSGGAKAAPENPKAPETAGSHTVEGVSAGTNAIKGNAAAPVLMVEFSDFQCPFSRRFYQQTFPRIESEYIAKGKVRFAYRDLPLNFHSDARPAAIAARCAGEQGKYWQMFDKLILSDSLDRPTCKKYAQELGLNVKAYESCLDNPAISKAVDDDLKDAQKFGADGTPSFFINGRFISGAYPFDVFKGIIDEELEKSRTASK